MYKRVYIVLRIINYIFSSTEISLPALYVRGWPCSILRNWVKLYIYIYIYVCVCIYIYIYIYICRYRYVICKIPFAVLPFTNSDWGFFVLYPSVVRQMPLYSSQRQGTVRTLPKLIVLFCVLFVCKRVLHFKMQCVHNMSSNTT